MSLMSKIVKFMSKKVLILFIILSIVSFIFAENKWFLISGLIVGGIFSLLRFGILSSTLTKILSVESTANASVMSVVRYVLNQAALIILLIFSAKFHLWFFIGLVAGVLLVPIVILANGITEAFGITHNNFE